MGRLRDRLNGSAGYIPVAIVAATMTVASSWAMRACDDRSAIVSRVEAAEMYVERHKVEVEQMRKDDLAVAAALAILRDEVTRKVDDARERLIRLEEGQHVTHEKLDKIRREVK